jgi:hypothetical protein
LNPRDQAYSVSELFDLVDRNRLVFGRWQLHAPYLPQCGVVSTTKHAARLAALPDREQFEAMELWRGTMAHHSAVLYRSVGVSSSNADDERWLSAVPLRLPSTICVRERLPAGAAAVLLNRAPQQHDLVLAIGPEEKRMVDAIDGRRTVERIVDVAGRERTWPLARAFFETLWRYDQVVFDRSATDERPFSS